MAIYHVSKNGNDMGKGAVDSPFLTISRAAKIADEGDTVIVHSGTYRECVSPERGARNELGRITYTAADGESVIIKGSEIVKSWKKIGSIWRADIENSLFGDYNPYNTPIDGDWLLRPLDPPHHTGMVYIGGEALDEVSSKDEARDKSMSWTAEVGEKTTTIHANFGEKDPNIELTEINVRRCCFYPEKTGCNYITVRGFEMSHGATQWAPPTTEQFGILGAHWSKGWIIENNKIHDSRCSGISVGKEISTGDNQYTKHLRKAGGLYQFEAVFSALRLGWSKETIGSHIIRNNIIYNCSQTGIVGHMGGAFSEIYENEIYNIGIKHEFFGYEIAGIKLHAPIDTQIHHNHIHDCTLGTWLDWQAQGTRVSSNIYYKNTIDIMIEVTHGPYLVDNNVFGSEQNLRNAAQGGAYVHNLFLGGQYQYPVLDRPTPYHLPHSTQIMGCSLVYSADDRFYNNIFANTQKEKNERFLPGLPMYHGCPPTLDEYVKTVFAKHGKCDIESFATERQPVYAEHNYYADGVPDSGCDNESVNTENPSDAKISIEDGHVYLEVTVNDAFSNIKSEIITTRKLGLPRTPESPYENPDCTPIIIDNDIFGNARKSNPTVGPIENLGTGRVKILLK